MTSNPEHASGADGRKTAIAAVAALLVVVFLAFTPVLTNGFVAYDDEEYILHNDHVRNGLTTDGLAWAFTTDWSANWHPLTWVTHQIDADLYGVEPWGHHLTSLLLHLANTVLVFLVFRIATGALWRPLFVAAIFGLHPLQVESVAWAAERKNVLCGFFMLLSILSYLRYARSPSVARFLVVAALFVCALLAKPMAVTLPFVLLLFDFWPLARLRTASFRRLLGEKALLLPLSVGSAIVTMVAQANFGAVVSTEKIPPLLRVQSAFLAIGTYLEKTVWPSDLALPCMHWRDPAFLPVAVAAGVVVLVSAAAIRLRRHAPYLLWGWLLFLGMLVPVIGIVKVGSQGAADRYMYISLIGLAVMACYGVARLTGWIRDEAARSRRRADLKWVAGAGCVLLAILTAAQAGKWKDTPTLFGHTLELMPENPVALGIVGLWTAKHGDMAAAESYFERWTRAAPENAEAWSNHGVSLIRLGRAAEAIPEFERALEVNPDFFVARINLGDAYRKLGEPARSVEILKKAFAESPDDYRVNLSYGRTLLALGREREGLSRLRAAERLRPGSVDIPRELRSYR